MARERRGTRCVHKMRGPVYGQAHVACWRECRVSDALMLSSRQRADTDQRRCTGRRPARLGLGPPSASRQRTLRGPLVGLGALCGSPYGERACPSPPQAMCRAGSGKLGYSGVSHRRAYCTWLGGFSAIKVQKVGSSSALSPVRKRGFPRARLKQTPSMHKGVVGPCIGTGAQRCVESTLQRADRGQL